MWSGHAIEIALSGVAGLLLGFVAWASVRSRSQGRGDLLLANHGALVLGLLILAAFVLGIFLTYALLGLRF